MLRTILIILLLLWILGEVGGLAFHFALGAFHFLIVVVIVLWLISLIGGNRNNTDTIL